MAYLLGDEGSRYTDDPDDSGGPTKWGVTQYLWSTFTDTIPTPEDIRNLTLFQVKPFYELLYWKPLGCDQIADAGIAIAIFDVGVLFGVPAISYLVQDAANLCGGRLTQDGKIGPDTSTCLNAIARDVFLASFHQLLMQRIERIIEKSPKDEKYRKGWVARIDRLLTLDASTVFNITT